MIDGTTAAAIAARYPHTLEAEPSGALYDTEVGGLYHAPTSRHAIGWVNAGEWNSDGTDPAVTRLARWWHNRGGRA